MSGIAETINAHIPDSDTCPQCGIQEGDRKPDGKKLTCLPYAKAVAGVGVVCWCSLKCMEEWSA